MSMDFHKRIGLTKPMQTVINGGYASTSSLEPRPMARPLFEDQALRKLIRLENHLTNTYAISRSDAVKINRYIRREFISPYALRKGTRAGKVIAFPLPVQKSIKTG